MFVLRQYKASMEAKPIPAFYCCYLLRSIKYPQSNYVGSTPNPKRRLRQHNGVSKGGARRTSRKNYRPWEMACVVTGFPSKIAALQFEWAWQNSFKTKHIHDVDRISKSQQQERTTKTGKSYKRLVRRPIRGMSEVEERIKNLHLLLHVPSFSRWPLAVRFFCEDLYHVWPSSGVWNDDKGYGNRQVSLDEGLLGESVHLDNGLPPSSQIRSKLSNAKCGNLDRLEKIAVTYVGVKANIEKAISLLSGDSILTCKICSAELSAQNQATLICPHTDCDTTTHMLCLAKLFLSESGDQGSLIPSSGRCPGCRKATDWIDLVKEMALRTRGEKELALLMKKPRGRKGKIDSIASGTSRLQPANELEDVEPEDEPLEDNWQPMDTEGDDAMSVSSATSDVSDDTAIKYTRPSEPRLEAVIEDSDSEYARLSD